ncbi:MAG: zinc ribbon domain-containing protein [Clostridia bacterium]|nr:zinc ribbon domain-containing protein [Clostridia bacterium]
MARYVKDYCINVSFDVVFQAVQQYLVSEGYEYIHYEGENVFKKGKGVWNGPSFYKLVFANGMVHLEAWMKYALLPGVYVGELGTDGFVGALAKGPFKKRLEQIEIIIVQTGGISMGQPMKAVTQTSAQSSPMQPQNSAFCTNCGAALEKGSAFCTNCGTPVCTMPSANGHQFAENNAYGSQPFTVTQETGLPTPPTNVLVDKKEYRSKYVRSFNKDIRNIAILCYVCVVATVVASFVMNNLYGLIDAALLAAFSVGLHLGKNKVFAYLILALSVFECIVAYVTGGSIGPYWWLCAGIWAVTTFEKADKQYKQYKNSFSQ